MARARNLYLEAQQQGQLWTPIEFVGLRLVTAWYDASKLDSIVLDSSGLVSEWRDLSGNNLHTQQVTAGSRAALVGNSANGLAGINFYLNKCLVRTGTGSRSIYYVQAVPRANAATWQGFHTHIDSVGGFASRIGGMRNSTGTGFFSGPAPAAAWQNGESLSPTGAFPNINQTNVIGYRTATGRELNVTGISTGNQDGGSAGGSGTEHELIALNIAPSNYQRQKLEGYMAWKWGVNNKLPATHPFINRPPLIGD